MTKHDAQVRCPRRSGTVYVELFSSGEHLSPSQAGDDHRVDNPDGKHCPHQPCTNDSDDGDGEHHRRNGDDSFDDPHDDAVNPASEEADRQAERNTDGECCSHGDGPGEEGKPRAINDSRVDVTAYGISSPPIVTAGVKEEVLEAGRLLGIVRGNEGCQQN